MKSLAETLGLGVPESSDKPKPDLKRLSAKKFAELVLDSPEYLDSLRRRITTDTLPAAIEQLLYYYKHGKPVDKLDIRDKTNDLSGMSVEQLESKAIALAEKARQLKESAGHQKN